MFEMMRKKRRESRTKITFIFLFSICVPFVYVCVDRSVHWGNKINCEVKTIAFFLHRFYLVESKHTKNYPMVAQRWSELNEIAQMNHAALHNCIDKSIQKN